MYLYIWYNTLPVVDAHVNYVRQRQRFSASSRVPIYVVANTVKHARSCCLNAAAATDVVGRLYNFPFSDSHLPPPPPPPPPPKNSSLVRCVRGSGGRALAGLRMPQYTHISMYIFAFSLAHTHTHALVPLHDFSLDDEPG